MRDFSFTKTDHPTMVEFNKRFGGIADFVNGIGNEYVWTKTAEVWVAKESDPKSGYWLYPSPTVEFSYSDKIAFTSNGAPYLVDPVKTKYGNYNGTEPFIEAIAGKYVDTTGVNSSGSALTGIIKIPSDASTSTIAYQNSGMQITNGIVITGQKQTSVIGYVNSPNPNAYPVDDGYTYTALGQLGAKVQIVTGSYTGTDTYGDRNPNSLTFEFEPKLLIISAVYNNNTAGCIAVIVPGLCGSFSNQGLGDQASSYVNILGSGKSGNTVTWYSKANAGTQLNSSTVTYNYVAIG